MLNRAWYLGLPPFRHHGAPGLDFFRHVADHALPYRRFRWSDYIEHFGQGTLRGVYERAETDNVFFGFAERESRTRPKSQERAALEGRLQAELERFLEERGVAGGGPAASRTAVPAETRAGERSPASLAGSLRSIAGRVPGARAMKALLTPRGKRVLREAYDVGMTQKPGEIRRLARMVARLRPRRVLEIGTSYGGTFYLWTRLASDDAVLISLDLPPWELDDPFEADKLRLFESFGRAAQRLRFLRADSHLDVTRREIEATLGGARLDFLFIDGDHSYDGVRRDFLDYAPYVRPGGLIAFHDVHPQSKGWGGEVPRFWAEIRARYAGRELIDDPRQDGFGIGVIRVAG